jgi:toxin ParE1/3/4
VSRRYEVRWAEVAVRDLEELVEYLEARQPGTTGPVLDRLERAAAGLELNPGRGRTVPELARFEIRTYRERVVRPWRLLYRIGSSRVLIVGLLDGRRDLETVLLARLMREA